MCAPPGVPHWPVHCPAPPEGRSQAVRAVERKCVRFTSAASDSQPCSGSPSPPHESLPRYLPRLHLSRARPVTRLIGDHFRLPWTYSPPQTHPPDLISHPVLFWRLASLTGGRSRSFLLFFRRGFSLPGVWARAQFPLTAFHRSTASGLPPDPAQVNGLPFSQPQFKNWWVCVFPVCCVCGCVCVCGFELDANSASNLVIRRKKRGGAPPCSSRRAVKPVHFIAHLRYSRPG